MGRFKSKQPPTQPVQFPISKPESASCPCPTRQMGMPPQQQMMQQQSMDKLEDTISGMAQKGALPITEKAMEQVQQQTDQGVE